MGRLHRVGLHSLVTMHGTLAQSLHQLANQVGGQLQGGDGYRHDLREGQSGRCGGRHDAPGAGTRVKPGDLHSVYQQAARNRVVHHTT